VQICRFDKLSNDCADQYSYPCLSMILRFIGSAEYLLTPALNERHLGAVSVAVTKHLAG